MNNIFQNIFKNDEVLLKIKFTEIPIKTNLFFNFYIKAADAFFDSENHLKKSTIFKYFGINKKTFFKQGDETISIECQNVTNMHLIPLAGKDSFWDSDFLLSFEIKEGKNSLIIMIKQNNFL